MEEVQRGGCGKKDERREQKEGDKNRRREVEGWVHLIREEVEEKERSTIKSGDKGYETPEEFGEKRHKRRTMETKQEADNGSSKGSTMEEKIQRKIDDLMHRKGAALEVLKRR